MNLEQIDHGVFVAPQLAPDHMPALAAAGVRSVINNRPDQEGGSGQPSSADLEAAARAAGLEYRHLPVVSGAHTPEQAQTMAQLVAALPKPVLAFCRSGRRSAALYSHGRLLAGA